MSKFEDKLEDRVIEEIIARLDFDKIVREIGTKLNTRKIANHLEKRLQRRVDELARQNKRR